MKILVTGASSLPGYRTVEEALRRGHEVVALRLRNPVTINNVRLREYAIDLRELESFRDLVFRERPDVVVHMAALGNVDECEKNKRQAWNVNVRPSMALASWACKLGYFLVYLSTDYVFDGERGFYEEGDPPAPVNYYGLTKLMGEVATMSSASGWAVVRASSIYGFGPGRKNFAKFLVERLSRGLEVKALTDQYTSPTHAKLLAEAIMEIVKRRLTGIFHVVGERFSRYDFALMVAENLGFEKSLVIPVNMKEFSWYARRPRDSSLLCEESRKRLKTDFYSTARAMRVLRKEYEEGG